MGEWHQYQALNPYHPCTNCQAGWGSLSHSIVDRVDYFKTDSCHETCKQLKEWEQRQELEISMAELG